ncbi:MAG: uridine kinase [Phycisphaeraceae bacterium]|nr:MAG: uridine kinase [Phycisphaeraceae bacterium]
MSGTDAEPRVPIVSPAAAPGAIVSMLGGALDADRPAVVGITGRVGSGKSTLARALCELAGAGVVLSTDEYLPDYERVVFEDRDDPAHAALDELAEHLRDLRDRGEAEIPAWSFHTHRREGTRKVRAQTLVVCEGIHALHASVVGSLDLRIFVHAARDTRWARWEAIELAGERGWGVDAAREHFDRVAEPTYDRHEQAYRAAADLIVDHGLGEG